MQPTVATPPSPHLRPLPYSDGRWGTFFLQVHDQTLTIIRARHSSKDPQGPRCPPGLTQPVATEDRPRGRWLAVLTLASILGGSSLTAVVTAVHLRGAKEAPNWDS